MAQKLLCLIGTGKGPQIAIQGMTGLHLYITGLKDGRVLVQTDSKLYEFEKDGIHPIEHTVWLQAEYTGTNKGLICTARGDALQRA